MAAKFEDSNIAGLGSPENVKARCDAGKAAGMEIWRIENFQVRRLTDKRDHGKFYSGDSYIVMNTYKKNDALLHDVHFWLGKQTTQDEAGTAAYKTVELDDLLAGKPVQHREVQDHESALFLSYFKPLMVLEGGIDSGFNHVKPESYQPRLLWIKGRKLNNMRVRQVERKASSLNQGDVFILDNGFTLYQWNGAQAGVMEKRRGAELAQALKDERDGKPKITVLEHDDDVAEFWNLLGGKGQIAPAAAGGSDTEEVTEKPKLFRLSDAGGKLTFKLEAEGRPSKSKLDTNDAFILDVGHEIFVWIGLKNERKNALPVAGKYLKDNHKSPDLSVTVLMEGGENEYFNAFFA